MSYVSPFAPAKPAAGGTTTSQVGGYQSPFAPKPSSQPTITPKTTGSTNGIPNTALKGGLGGGYSASNVLDMPNTKSSNSSSLGKPLLAFENTKTMSSQLLSDRVAPNFDPTIPQKIDSSVLENGRMPVSASEAVRKATGAESDENLDHLISLEVGGSNQSSNLNLEHLNSSGVQPSLILENQTAKDVASGKISYIQGQINLARAKGVQLPDDPGFSSSPHPLASGYDKPAPNQVGTKSQTKPQVTLPLGNEEKAQNSTLAQLADKIGSKAESAVSSVGSYFKNLFTNPDKTVKSSDNSIASEIGVNTVVHPIQTAKNFATKLYKSTGDAETALATSAMQFKSDVLTPSTNRDTATKISSTLNLLQSIANLVFMPVGETFNIASQLPIIKPAADAIGVLFNDAGKVSSFSADSLLNQLPISQASKDELHDSVDSVSSLAGQILLGGYIYENITDKMVADPDKVLLQNSGMKSGADLASKYNLSEEEIKPIIQDVKDKADQINTEPENSATIEKPTTEQEAAYQYRTKVIEPAKTEGKAIILSSDEIKDVSKDYAPEKHSIYSKATRKLYYDEVAKSDNPDVILTGGGPGSGKTEFLVKNLAKDFSGVIYDSSLSNYAQATDRIDYAEKHGKNVKIYYSLADLENAKQYTLGRERRVPDADFNRMHAGAINTAIRLIQDGKDVSIVDNRGATSAEDVANKIKGGNILKGDKALAELEKIRYTEEEVGKRTKNVKSETDNQLGRKAKDSGSDGRPLHVSSESGEDQGKKSDVAKRSSSVLQEKLPRSSGGSEESNGRTDAEKEIVKPKSRFAKQLKPIEGTGDLKTRGLSEGVIEKAVSNTPSRLPDFAPDEAKILEQKQIAAKLTDIFGDLPQYKAMNVADQGAKATQLFEENPDLAKQIAYGEKAPPKGLTPEAVFVVVEQDAIERGDGQTLKELANSRLTQEATTMGQRIRMLAERNPEAPTDAIRELQEKRIEAAKKPIAEETAKAEKSIKQTTADRMAGKTRITWDSFVESITC